MRAVQRFTTVQLFLCLLVIVQPLFQHEVICFPTEHFSRRIRTRMASSSSVGRRRVNRESFSRVVGIFSRHGKLSLMMRCPMDALVRIAQELEVTLDRLLSGVQPQDRAVYLLELVELLADCTLRERRILRDVTAALKQSLRETDREG